MSMIERYYLKADHEREWSNVTLVQFIAAEQAAGFRSKFGDNHPATGGFSGRGMSGRVDYVEVNGDKHGIRKQSLIATAGLIAADRQERELAALVPQLVEALQAAYDFYMSKSACGDFTCACNDPKYCGICEIRQSTEAALAAVKGVRG